MKIFKQVSIKDKISQQGVATLMIVTVLSLVFISVSIAIARTSLVKFQSVETLKNSRKSYYLAESGIEDTLIQLEEDLSYSGNPQGENTPIGMYYSNIDKLGDDYTITASSKNGGTERSVALGITLYYELAEVTTKATYMADFFWMSGEGARVRGDVWTNDDFDVIDNGIIEGNLAAAGKGSMATNWVWDGFIFGNPALQGGQIKDNPDTPEFDGNIVAADDVKVSGPTAYVQGNVTTDGHVYKLFGGQVYGTISEHAGLTWEQIPVPGFQFDEYKQQAIQKGTYFANSNAFENYVDSLDTGIERRLPEDVYFVKSGAVKINAGSPVYLDGLLVVVDSLYIYSAWYQNAQNGLPAIVCGKYLYIENKFNFWSWNYDHAGPVRINGIVFAEKDVSLFRTFGDEDIIVEGAAWAGDDISIGTHSYIHYNLDPMAVQGFDFVNGISDLQKNYWEEII